MVDYYRIQNSVIKKSDIVLVEQSGNEFSGFKLKLILKGNFVVDFDYELYSDLEYDLDILDGIDYIKVREKSIDSDNIISVNFINKSYLAGLYFEEKFFTKSFIFVSFLLTDGIDEVYSIITDFKTIEEGVKSIE
jgi:hypothetical protein